MAKIVTIGYGNLTKQLVVTGGYGTEIAFLIGEPICWLRREAIQSMFQVEEVKAVFKGELTQMVFQRSKETLIFRGVKPCKM